MTDPVPSPETTPTPAEARPGGNFGETLRAAREGAGMSVAALAERLRLHVKQVEALERCDLQALPALIYVRGFLRACARELKIDPVPLLADLDRRAGVDSGAIAAPSDVSFRFRPFGDGSKPIIVLVLVVLVLAGLVGTLIPRRQSVPAKPVQEPVPAAPPPVEIVPAPAPPSVPAESTAGASAPAASIAAEFTRSPTAPVGVQAPVPAIETPAPPVAVTAVARKPATGEHASGSAAQDADSAALFLRVHAAAWVEVVQADGTAVLSQICPAGSVQTIKGRPPLRVVIGNAAAVEAEFRGSAVDLSSYVNANGVARLTLE